MRNKKIQFHVKWRWLLVWTTKIHGQPRKRTGWRIFLSPYYFIKWCDVLGRPFQPRDEGWGTKSKPNFPRPNMLAEVRRGEAGRFSVFIHSSKLFTLPRGVVPAAMMAARAGAKHVYACEMNADVAQKAQAVIKVPVLCQSSHTRRFSLWMDGIPFDRFAVIIQFLSFLNRARSFLRATPLCVFFFTIISMF